MLSTREFVKSTCTLGFQERPQPRLWTLFVHSSEDDLKKELVRATLKSESTPQDGNIMEIVPSAIFEENYEFWMKAVPGSPILLNYLPTAGRYSDFDDEIAWQYPNSLRKDRHYWHRRFHFSRTTKNAENRLSKFGGCQAESFVSNRCRRSCCCDRSVLSPTVSGNNFRLLCSCRSFCDVTGRVLDENSESHQGVCTETHVF